ncbi:MAG TPA: phosphoribosyltransferase [Kofleriaceae bacterium]|jgi:predicted phosphoribosyltransferase
MHPFRDRRDAGRRLARRLQAYRRVPDVLVLALPRGGVPVGYEIAISLGAPLDVLVVRKLGVPGHPELAMGAIASGGIQVVDQHIVNMLGISREAFEAVEARERDELARREGAFRSGRAPLDVTGKVAILVDDGLATGASMAAAIDALRTRSPARLVAAVPVAPPDTCQALRERADDMICLITPDRMRAVGLWYEDFEQTSDAEVRQLLDAAARELPAYRSTAAAASRAATAR